MFYARNRSDPCVLCTQPFRHVCARVGLVRAGPRRSSWSSSCAVQRNRRHPNLKALARGQTSPFQLLPQLQLPAQASQLKAAPFRWGRTRVVTAAADEHHTQKQARPTPSKLAKFPINCPVPPAAALFPCGEPWKISRKLLRCFWGTRKSRYGYRQIQAKNQLVSSHECRMQ